MSFAFPAALLPFFQWCDNSLLSVQIRQSTYIFPVIEVVHLFGLTVLFGSIVTMDLRLLGLGLRRQPVSQLAKDISPFMWAGFWVTFVTGVLLFFSEAMKCYTNAAFPYKMAFLILAVSLSLTLHRKVTVSDNASPALRKFVACLSLFLLLGVGVGGRAIGFV